MKPIPNSDRCNYCHHWSGDDEKPFRIVSEQRFKWLARAAEMLSEMGGDDDWIDWLKEEKILLKKGE